MGLFDTASILTGIVYALIQHKVRNHRHPLISAQTGIAAAHGMVLLPLFTLVIGAMFSKLEPQLLSFLFDTDHFILAMAGTVALFAILGHPSSAG